MEQTEEISEFASAASAFAAAKRNYWKIAIPYLFVLIMESAFTIYKFKADISDTRIWLPGFLNGLLMFALLHPIIVVAIYFCQLSDSLKRKPR